MAKLPLNDWLAELVEYLGPEDAAEWLSYPNSELRDRTPLEAVGDGDQESVAECVEAMIQETE